MELRLGWPTWNNSPDKYGISFRSLGETVAFEAFGVHSRLLVMVLSLLPEVADSHTVEQAGLVGGIRVSIMGGGGLLYDGDCAGGPTDDGTTAWAIKLTPICSLLWS